MTLKCHKKSLVDSCLQLLINKNGNGVNKGHKPIKSRHQCPAASVWDCCSRCSHHRTTGIATCLSSCWHSDCWREVQMIVIRKLFKTLTTRVVMNWAVVCWLVPLIAGLGMTCGDVCSVGKNVGVVATQRCSSFPSNWLCSIFKARFLPLCNGIGTHCRVWSPSKVSACTVWCM